MTIDQHADYDDVPLPDYEDEESRSEIGKDNDRAYERRRLEIQRRLDQLEQHSGFGAALRALHEQQSDAGFIHDDLRAVTYFQQYGEHGAFFVGQVNPTRRDRGAGAGRRDPPRGVRTRNSPDESCFLDIDNVRWQQRGIQLPYQFPVNGHEYNALDNPFRLTKVHLTIATSLHQPQSWQLDERGKFMPKDARISKIRQIVEDLYAIASRLDTFVGFYNGPGAGASIPQHMHFHFMEVPAGHQLFPLQHAAIRSRARDYRPEPNGHRGLQETVVVNGEYYPLSAFWLSGRGDAVMDSAVRLLSEWDELNGEAASANIAAITEQGEVALYVVPRNKFFSRSPGLAGIVGGLEALGEIVFCTEDEVRAIATQRVDYQYMWKVLEAVRPPNLAALGRLTRALIGGAELGRRTEVV